jgi:hypothetical protein
MVFNITYVVKFHINTLYRIVVVFYMLSNIRNIKYHCKLRKGKTVPYVRIYSVPNDYMADWQPFGLRLASCGWYRGYDYFKSRYITVSADPSDRSIVSVVESPAERVRNPNGAGRPKGSPNRTTATMRYLLDQIVAGHMHNIDRALNDVLRGTPAVYDAGTGKLLVRGTAPNPAGYVDRMTNIMDFNLPRLSRVEVKDDRAPLAAIEIPEGATQEDAQQAYLAYVKG